MRPLRLGGPVSGVVLVLLLAASAPAGAQAPSPGPDPAAAPVAWLRLVHAGVGLPAQLRVDGEPAGLPVLPGAVLPWLAVAPGAHVLAVDGAPLPLPRILDAGDRLTVVAAPGPSGLLLRVAAVPGALATADPVRATSATLVVIDGRSPGAAPFDLRGARPADGVLAAGLAPGGEPRAVVLAPGSVALSLRTPGAKADTATASPWGFDAGAWTTLVVRDGAAGRPEILLLPDALPGEHPAVAILPIGPAGPGLPADTYQSASPKGPFLRYALVNRLPHPVVVRIAFAVLRADGRVLPQGSGWVEPYGADGHLIPPRTDVGPGVTNGLLLLNGAVPEAARYLLVPSVLAVQTVRVGAPVSFVPGGWPGGTPAAGVLATLGLPEGTTSLAYPEMDARFADGKMTLDLATPADPPIAFCAWMRGSAEKAWRRIFPCTPVGDVFGKRVVPPLKGARVNWMWGLCGIQSFITPFDPDAPGS